MPNAPQRTGSRDGISRVSIPPPDSVQGGGTLATLGLIMFSSSLGDLSSIAVFIWQSGSEINERIKGSVGGGSGSSSLIATG